MCVSVGESGCECYTVTIITYRYSSFNIALLLKHNIENVEKSIATPTATKVVTMLGVGTLGADKFRQAYSSAYGA